MTAGFAFCWNRESGEVSGAEGLVEELSGLTVGFAGQVHDRRELAARLALPANADDPSLVAAAYRRWGAEFPANVLGEYVVAVFDPEQCRLVVTSDAMGLWQAYVRADGRAVEVASSLLHFAKADIPFNRDYFAHFLSCGYLISKATPYSGVDRTIPGAALVYDDHGCRQHDTWSLGALASVRTISEDDAAAQLRDLLTRAMRNGVAGSEATLIALSGGLDSSTIACIAAADGLPGLSAYSLIHADTPEFDESVWARSVVDAYRLPWRTIDLDRCLPFDGFPQTSTPEPSIALFHQSQHRAIDEILRETGARVILDGTGGDVTLGVYTNDFPTFVTDPLFCGRLRTAWRQLRDWQAYCRIQRSLGHWVKGGVIWPSYRFLVGDRQDKKPLVPPPPYMLVRAEEMMHAPPALPRCRSPWLQSIAELLQMAAMSTAASRNPANLHVLRTPLMYRNLLDFLLTLPVDFLYRPTVDRYLQRVALKGVLPDKVRRRAKKIPGSWSLIQGLRESPDWRDYLSRNSLLAEWGLIDLKLWRDAVAMAAHGNTQGDMYLMATVSAEVWLRMQA